MNADEENKPTELKVGEGKARYELSWLVNEAFNALNLFSKEDGLDVAGRVLAHCEAHPHLALEYYIVEDTGEKVTPLEAFLRNRLEPEITKTFCFKFPEALRLKSDATDTYPLHVACEEYPHGDGQILIPFLAEQFPEAVWNCDGDGNLPLHKVLRRLAKLPSIAAEARHELPEIETLVQFFPESTITRGMDLAGRDPLHFVLSQHLPPAVMKAVLSHVPETVTEFTFSGSYFAGGMTSMTRYYADAFSQFLPQLQRLVFQPSHTAVSPVFTADGWSIFFQQLTRCPMLEHLEMELPYTLLREDSQASTIFAQVLPQLTELKALILSFPKGGPVVNGKADGNNAELLLSKPISELITTSGGSLSTLVVKDGIVMDPQPILAAIMQHSGSPLLSLDIRSSSGKNQDVTESLAALIASNSNLENLFMKNSKLNPKPIFQALAQNTNLQSLALPNLIGEATNSEIEDMTTGTLSGVLQHYNATLERIQCLQTSFEQATGTEHQRIQHYASLNRFGRARARKETSNCYDMIDLLVAVQCNIYLNRREKEKASVSYGLLREAPNQWTCHIPI